MNKEQNKNEANEPQEETFVQEQNSGNDEFYTGFSPLDEPVKERSYTKANIEGQDLNKELEEPSFDAPNFSDFDEEDKEPSTFNPEMENLDKKEQMYATEQMVDTVLDVYGKAHVLANKATKLKEQKIAKAMESGEIDPSLQVPIDEMGNSLGLMQYVQEYNSQLDDAIKLEDDFVEKVRPPMIRVFQKKGLAMTDEQFLAVTFGTDLVTKGAMVFSLVKQNNKLIEMWKDQSGAYRQPSEKSQNRKPKQKPQPQPETEQQNNYAESNQTGAKEPKKEQKESFVEPEEFTAESMVDDMMGMKEQSNFRKSEQADNMPQFGDPEMLSKLDKLSKSEDTSDYIDVTPKTTKEKPKKKRGRPKKKKD